MPKLTNFAGDVYSQFGEDGIIAHIFNVIGKGRGYCVEFGANDGVSCSNTANLWRRNQWSATLIEANLDLIPAIEENSALYSVEIINSLVGDEPPNRVDDLIKADEVDYMSIDVDGNDWLIWDAMTRIRPRVVSIEYNRTLPLHVSFLQKKDEDMGASARALHDLGKSKGYVFLGLTWGNMFFVQDEYAIHFSGYDKALEDFLGPNDFTYLVSNFTGSVGAMGPFPPWGINGALMDDDARIFIVANTPEEIIDTIKKRYPSTVYLSPDNWNNIIGSDRDGIQYSIHRILDFDRPDVIAFHMANVPVGTDMSWLTTFVSERGYHILFSNHLILAFERSHA